MPISKIENESNPKLNPGNGGSHVWLRKQVIDDLRKKRHIFDSLDLNNSLGGLKRLRTLADYGVEDINDDDLSVAKDLSDKVQSILIKRYNEKS